MAILGGLFSSKKDKHKQANATSLVSAAPDLDHESLAGTEYNATSPVTQRPPSSIYHSSRASSSNIMLPFRKKKSLTGSATEPAPSHAKYPTTRSEAAVDLIRPPPSKASVFGSYEADIADSIYSLPTASHAKSESHHSTQPAITPPRPSKKSGGLFSWTRERLKRQPSRSPSKEPSPDLDAPRPFYTGSQVDSVFQSTPSFSHPHARPRGDSVASESSQRISVAAFREMQARRSSVYSPTSSDFPRPTPIAGSSALTGSPGLKAPVMVSSNTSQTSLQQRRGSWVTPAPRSHALMSSTSSDTSSEEEESSDDEPHKPTLKKAMKSKSETGHRSSSWNTPTVKKRPPLPAQDTSRFLRPRVSVSTSAPSLDPAAKQDTALNKPPQKSRKKDSDTSESASDASSEDDTPLATLVGPPRPGSAVSTSTSRTLPPKPLIDINTLISPVLPSSFSTPSLIRSVPQPSPKDTPSPSNVSGRLATLAQEIRSKSALGRSSGNDSSEAGTKPREPRRSITSLPIISTSLGISPSQTSSPPRSAAPSNHRPSVSIDTLSTAKRESAPNLFSNDTASAKVTSPASASSFEMIDYPRPKRVSLCLDDTSAPIVPKPVLHRPQLSGFKVTSRPEHPRRSSSTTSPTVTQTPAAVASSATESEPFVFPAKSGDTKRSSSFDLVQSAFSGFDLEDRLANDLDKSSTFTNPTSNSLSPSDVISKTSSSTVRILDSNQPQQLSLSPMSSVTPSVSASPPHTQPSPRKKQPSPSSTLISQIPPRQPFSASKRSSLAPSAKPNLISVATAPVSTTSSVRSSLVLPSMSSSRQKTQSLVSMIPDSPMKSLSSGSMVPPRPFASSSPASSTGGSSSGKGAPVTPRDGSDIGSEVGPGRRAGTRGTGVGAGMSAAGHEAKPAFPAQNAKRAGARKSASHERAGDTVDSFADDEARIRDRRRRSEARNAIELGNVMHKPIKLDDDDEEQRNLNIGINPMMSVYNPMLGLGMGMGGIPPSNLPMQMPGPPNQWVTPQIPGGPMMQQFMIPPPPPNVDPHFLAAHQQAMMVAKQAYQYSVAQQAMAAAGDEWERGSSASFFGGGGGGWGGSTAGSMIFNPAPRSMYAGSVYGGSEIGGPAGWGARSAYGSGFGPGGGAGNRSSMLRGGPLPRPESVSHPSHRQQQQQQVRPSAKPRTKTAPPESRMSEVSFLGQEQTSRGRGGTPPPPTSWKRSSEGR